MSHNFSSQDMDSVRQTGLPIISVHGSQDAAIDCANSDVITKGLKCKQFIIQNQGHGLELTATKELYDIITVYIIYLLLFRNTGNKVKKIGVVGNLYLLLLMKIKKRKNVVIHLVVLIIFIYKF